MSFQDNIKDSLKILAFDESALARIADSKEATGYGFATLAIAGIATAVAQLNLVGMISNPVALIIGLFIGYSIYHFIAKFLLGGKATGMQYFRSLSNSFVVYWFTFLPIIGIFLQLLAGLWLLVINIFILNKVHRLSLVKAIILGLLPFVIMLVLVLIAAFMYAGVMDPSSFLPA